MGSSCSLCDSLAMADISDTFVETRGFTTHVARCGKGPPLLLLHGWPEFWATWVPLFDRHFLKHWAHDTTAFDGVLERWVDNFMRPGNLQGGSPSWPRLRPSRPRSSSRPASCGAATTPVLRCDWIDVVGEYAEAGIAEDAGHFVHYGTPDPAAVEIDRFLRGIGYRDTPWPWARPAGRRPCRGAASMTGWPPRPPCSSSPSEACRRRAPRSGAPARG